MSRKCYGEHYVISQRIPLHLFWHRPITMKLTTSEISMNSVDSAKSLHKTTVFDCTVLELPQIANRSGNISILESNRNCPFKIQRVYYLYDVPSGASRGGHAHRELQQLIVAASGSFDVVLDDGCNRRTVFLNRPNYALYIPSGVWRELHNFSSGSISLVLASHIYNENDYVRDYQEFQTWKR